MARGASGQSIIVVGDDNLQNRMFVAALKQALGYHCDLSSNFAFRKDDNRNLLVLCDFESREFANCSRWDKVSGNPNVTLAIFNVPDEARSKGLAASGGVQGLFRRSVTPPCLLQGIKALVRGESWFENSTAGTAAAGKEPVAGQEVQEALEKRLTTRERTVLESLAQGHSNSQIAQRLHISVHTVKAHLYSIFRKIEVRNRLQAATWAREAFTEPFNSGNEIVGGASAWENRITKRGGGN